MKKSFVISLWAFCLICASCAAKKESGTEVVLETTAGEIRVLLYDDTPGHRDNFVRNVRDGLYTGVTFHRVIRNFMIQTGDPKTRPGGYVVRTDANGDTVPERIPAEINWPKRFHRRGALAAARDSDGLNPDRQSDKHQFYIITGKTCTPDDMDAYEDGRAARDADALYMKARAEHQDELDRMRRAGDRSGVSDLLEDLRDEARATMSDNPPITYPSAVRRSYAARGGAPWLDNEYTVFGEVVEGMKVVEAIQKVKTDANDVPLVPITVTKAYVVE